MMTQSRRSALRDILHERYEALRERLARRLGSQDHATEALHETWLRLAEGGELGPIANPDAYLYRAAVNSAAKLASSERKLLNAVEIEAIFDLADDSPGPERIAIARSEIAALKRALRGVTKRQRTIFLESFTSDATHEALAERFGLSVRTIQQDHRTALLHVASRMDENSSLADGAVRVSRNRKSW